MDLRLFSPFSLRLDALLNAGTSPSNSSERNKALRTANVICFATLFNTFCFILATALSNNWTFFLTSIGSYFVYCIAYLLMWKKRTLAARILMLGGGTIILYLGTAIGTQETLLPVMLFPISACSFIIFDWKENKLASTFAILPLAAFAFGLVTDFHVPGITPMLEQQSLPVVRFVSVFGSIVTFFGAIAFFRFQIQQRKIEIDSYVQRIRDEQQMQIYAHKMASLGEMAAGMAHEINSPLTALLIRIRKLQKSIPSTPSIASDEQTRVTLDHEIEAIVSATNRINSIIRSLETIAYSGETVAFKNVVLSEIVQNAVDLYSERFRNSKIQLTLQVPEGLDSECSPGQISQILLSLLQNAFDAALLEKDERWVSILAHEKEGTVRIEVVNSGKRIPLSNQERIFEPFFSTKRPGHGTGLGLSISRALAEEHHGKLDWIPDAVNTTFRLTLPKKQPAPSMESV
jgi:signal transduction histidine kinase